MTPFNIGPDHIQIGEDQRVAVKPNAFLFVGGLHKDTVPHGGDPKSLSSMRGADCLTVAVRFDMKGFILFCLIKSCMLCFFSQDKCIAIAFIMTFVLLNLLTIYFISAKKEFIIFY